MKAAISEIVPERLNVSYVAFSFNPPPSGLGPRAAELTASELPFAERYATLFKCVLKRMRAAASGLAAIHRGAALDELDCTAISDQHFVRRHQTQWFEKRLSNQHPVKWVRMM
jgi:hypothetical protein